MKSPSVYLKPLISNRSTALLLITTALASGVSSSFAYADCMGSGQGVSTSNSANCVLSPYSATMNRGGGQVANSPFSSQASTVISGDLTINKSDESGRIVSGGNSLTVNGTTTVKITSTTGNVIAGIYGIGARNGGVVTLNDVNAVIEGHAQAALFTDGKSRLTAGNVNILTQIKSSLGWGIKTSSYGIAANGGTINIAGGYIETDDSFITVPSGWNNIPLVAVSGGSITSSGPLEIKTNGIGARAVLASGGGGKISLNDITIKTLGVSSPGLQAGGGTYTLKGQGKIDVSGIMNIETLSESSPGLFLTANGSELKALGGAGRSSIIAGTSAIIMDGSVSSSSKQTLKAYIGNADISTTKTNADLFLISGSTSASSELTLSNKTIARAPDNGWLLNVSGLTLNETTFTLDPSKPVTGAFNFNVDNSTVEGSVTTANGSSLDINLSNYATWELRGRSGNTSEVSKFTNLTINQTAKVDASGGAGVLANYTLQGNVSNKGTLSLHDGSAGDRLTINGSYNGVTGSVFEMDTALGDSSSPTDLLHITGSASGQTNLVIKNASGVGLKTTGDGIRIIQIDGASPDKTFALKGDYTTPNGAQAVVAGAYAYTLWHNGETNSDGNWYLRTKDKDKEVKPGPGKGTGTGTGSGKGTGTGTGTGSGSTNGDKTIPQGPLYQPLVPIAEAYPQALLNIMEMDTYRQRRGGYAAGGYTEGSNTGAENYGQDDSSGPSLMWARLKVGTGTNMGSKSTSGVTQDFDNWTLRSGADGVIYEAGDQSISVGAHAIYGQNKTKVTSYYGNGTIDTTAWGIGASATWRGYEGAYVDVQGQTLWHSSDLSSRQLGGLMEENTGLGYSGSIEVGRQIAVGDGFSVTPQAQLSYYWIDFQNFRDPRNTRVALRDNTRLVGRLGVSAEKQTSWQGAEGDTRQVQFYGIMNLYYNIVEGTVVNVAGVDFSHDKERTWGGIGIGSSYSWGDDRYSVLGEANVKSAFENMSDNYDMSGTVRMRVKW